MFKLLVVSAVLLALPVGGSAQSLPPGSNDINRDGVLDGLDIAALEAGVGMAIEVEGDGRVTEEDVRNLVSISEVSKPISNPDSNSEEDQIKIEYCLQLLAEAVVNGFGLSVSSEGYCDDVYKDLNN
jgi:hypothetical protein